MTHPMEVDPSHHKEHVVLSMLQLRRGQPTYCERLLSLSELSDAFASGGIFKLSKKLEPNLELPRHAPFYIEAFKFDIYPHVYEAMRLIGIKVITIDEADRYISGELPWPPLKSRVTGAFLD